MFRAFADLQTVEMLNLPRPKLQGNKPDVIACPMSDAQFAIQQQLVKRYERIRAEKVDPREDNALAITTDGRKLETDARLIAVDAQDLPDSKINRLVETVTEIFNRKASTRGTQLIFGDTGVNPTQWGYSSYAEIIQKLVAAGIPGAQIASIGEAESDAKKQARFKQVRSGAVRVLLGSNQKMGTGTNVQTRLVALHHLDVPWKPAEVEQRDGRILRHGNETTEVSIHRYVAEGRFDAYMGQALETKARFINQVMTGDNLLRTAEDIGNQELSYAEVKAIASGNPAVLTLAEAGAELQRLHLLKKNHLDEQLLARRNVRDLPRMIEQLNIRLEQLTADAAKMTNHDGEPVTISGRGIPRADLLQHLAAKLESLPVLLHQPAKILCGRYHGLEFGLILDPEFSPDVYLQGEITRKTRISRDHQGPRAILNALDRLAGGYQQECHQLRQELNITQSQFRDYQARLGKPFLQETYLTELTVLRDQLKAKLSAATQHVDDNSSTTVKLADRVNALKSSHQAEPTADRPRQGQITADELITSRIRKREQVAECHPGADDSPNDHSFTSTSPSWDAAANRPATIGL